MQYNSIGKLVASFGLKGELVLEHALGKKTSLKGLETLFVEVRKDDFLPYFVEETRIKSDTEIYIKLEGVNTKEEARKLTPRQVWLSEEDFERFAARSSAISLLGFHIINEGEDLGPIEEVIEQPHQVLCKIILNANEALIPINEEFLQKIDQKKKQVHVVLPDGLLELYR
ncbi:ribosome maturation factor RimM [Flavihumibacter rivuli]|uniref:ribosome maturation factor RimM n=1 Tax=Flavihumibacter rivuli TaxID=2838156 RepID=UPI001EFB1CE0|nr:ribosome maturation factor RimM [Flavihumibacter rivuli]ULQ58391.1 ribosome maturation factor RimM [Flavihumibacter rivuli]